jgi:hypothetical protein
VAINLTGAQAAVERLLLVDDCRIDKGEDRTESTDVWDPVTGNYTPGAVQTIFTGKCQVTPASRLPQDEMIGGVPTASLDYVIKISKDAVLADILMPEDLITILGIHDGGDLLLVGQRFEVVSFEVATYSVLRTIGCTRWVPRPNA